MEQTIKNPIIQEELLFTVYDYDEYMEKFIKFNLEDNFNYVKLSKLKVVKGDYLFDVHMKIKYKPRSNNEKKEKKETKAIIKSIRDTINHYYGLIN